MKTRVRVGAWLAFLLSLPSVAAADDLRLVHAVKNSSAPAALRALIAQGVNVNAAEPDGTTALAWAAHRDEGETADLLIRAGAKVDAANEYGVTPLTLACANRSTSMVERLLKAGADPNVTQWTGETPLITGARTGNLEAVKLLLAHGADVNAKETRQGHTALMRAVAGKHPEVVRVLVERGADVHARSKGGFSAMLFASQQGELESARILLAAGVDVNELTSSGPDARRDVTGGLCVSMNKNAPPCFVPRENGSALVVAAASGREALAVFLLQNGADPNAADANGRTALHYAVPGGWAAIDSYFYRPFHDKVRLPNMPELVKALLRSRGANPNAQIAQDYSPYSLGPYRYSTSAVGATPFALAAAAGDVGIMRMLVEAGADPNLTLKDGSTPLMLAAGVGRTQDRRTKEEETNALEAVKLVAQLGADVNAANTAGRTPLHGAASVGADAIIQFLADKGANLDAPDKRGLTPFRVAAGHGSSEDSAERVYKSTMDLLLKLGAKPPERATPGTDKRP